MFIAGISLRRWGSKGFCEFVLDVVLQALQSVAIFVQFGQCIFIDAFSVYCVHCRHARSDSLAQNDCVSHQQR